MAQSRLKASLQDFYFLLVPESPITSKLLFLRLFAMQMGRGKGGPVKGRAGRSSRGGRGRGLRRGGGRGRQVAGQGTVLPSVFRPGRKVEANGGRGRRNSHGNGNTGYEFEGDGDEKRDRHKYDEEAGDSDDLPDPDDSDFEDEELDEDEAFDSADEEKYGGVMSTILERKAGKRGEEDDVEDDGGISLMDLLNANEAAAEGAGEARQISSGIPTAGPTDRLGKGKEKEKARVATNTPEKSAESALGGVKMKKGMKDKGTGKTTDRNKVNSAVESEREDSDEGEEESDEEEGRHDRLIEFVGSLGEKAEAAARAGENRRASQMMEEGEFNATGVARGGDGEGQVSGKGGVTMEALVGSLQNSKGFAAVKKQVAAFSGTSEAPSAPVSKIVELRAEREAAYAERKNEMVKWVAPVQANRQAETLDFTPSIKMNLSNAALASNLEASTALEKEVEMLLTAGGASEAGLAEKEMEELKSKAYTVEEVQERQAELSKMRALMFYQERKHHHMNKIKSKVYRKIKKRQKERMGDGEDGEDDERAEVAARKRAEERMSLRHKNTTKWVKKALRAKGGAGQDDRKAISEQLRLGQELRAKMEHPGGKNSSEEDESSDEGDEQGEGGAAAKRKPALRESDRRELEDIGGEEEGNDGITGKGAALLKMAFMQRAMDKQRARAKEEASLLLRELEEAAAADDDSDADTRVTNKRKINQSGNGSSLGGGSRGNASARDVSTEERTRAAEEIAEALPVGTLRPSAVGMDSRARSSVSAPITIDLGGSSEGHGSSDSTSVAASASAEDAVEQGDEGKVQALKDGAAEGLSAAAVSTRPDLNPVLDGLGGQTENGDRDGGVGTHVLDDGEEENDEGNPWLVPTPRRSRERRRASGVTGEILLDVGKAAATALSAFGGGAKNSGIDDKERKMDVGGGYIHADVAAVGSNYSGKGENSAVAVSDNIEVQRNHTVKKRKKRQSGGAVGGDVETKASGNEKEGGVKRPKRMESSGGDAAATTGELAGLSNDELVRRAFAAPDFEADFKASKDDAIEAEVSGQRREKLPKEMAGWGSWTGEGAPVASGPSKRERIALKEQKEKEEKIKKARKDARLPTVVINEKRQKRSAKYMVAKVPYPFTSPEQYERSLRQPIGADWNTSQSVRDMTRPAVVVRAGTVVAPMKLGKLQRKAGDEQAAAMAKGRGGGKRTGGSGRGGKATGKHRSRK